MKAPVKHNFLTGMQQFLGNPPSAILRLHGQVREVGIGGTANLEWVGWAQSYFNRTYDVGTTVV